MDNVFIGTLGDYQPGTTYEEKFPEMNEFNTNYPGCTYLTNSQPANDSSETVKYSFDTTAYYRLIQPDIILTSDVAVNSPRHFTFGETSLYHKCTWDLYYTNNAGPEEQAAIDAALTIYYKDVIDENGVLRDFDITLTESPALTNEVTWSIVSRPTNSGILTNSTLPIATFSNPTNGGLYIFNADIRGVDTKCQAWLPVAGPDISYYWTNEIARIKDWGVSYRSNLATRSDLPGPPFFGGLIDAGYEELLRHNDFMSFGTNLDWNLPTNSVAIDLLYNNGDTPCGLADVVTTNSSMGDVCRFTMYRKVIDAAKRNNMGFSLVAKEMGFLDIEVLYGPDLIGYLQGIMNGSTDVGTPDSSAATESYKAGIDLHDGLSLETVMTNRGLKMLHPGMRAEKEWPSYESTTGGLVIKKEANTRMEELVE